MSLPPILVELKANAGEFMAKMGEARHEVSKLESEAAPHAARFAAIGKAALLGFAGVAVGVGTMAVKAALEGEKAHAALAQAVKNAGGSMEELEPKVNRLSDRFAKLGFTNDELEQGLASMTMSLHDPEKAMGAMGLAADLARAKHIDLTTASVAVAKAMEGQLRPLKQLGIDLPVSAGGALKLQQANEGLAKAQDAVHRLLEKFPDAAKAGAKGHEQYEAAVRKVDEAQRKLSDTQQAAQAITAGLTAAVGGQASAAADTYAGKLEATKAQAENLLEKLGNDLLPVIAQVIDKTTSAIGVAEKHATTAKILAGIVGGILVAAMVASVVSTVAATAAVVAHTAAQIAHTVAVTAGSVVMAARIVAVYAGTAAEIAANIATKAWAAGQWLLNAALTANPIGLVIAAVALLVGGVILAYKHSETFRNIVSGLWDVFKKYTVLGEVIAHFGQIRDAIGWVIDKIEALVGALGSIHVPQALKDAADLVGKVGGALGDAASFATHPHFAKGVQNFSGGVALVGENGPEYVDLPRGSNVYPNGTAPASAGNDSSEIVDAIRELAQLVRSIPRELAVQARTA